ncbi:MAG: hypothetical protein ABIH99_04580 [Candidatus Micrarchaeota archaeon]
MADSANTSQIQLDPIVLIIQDILSGNISQAELHALPSNFGAEQLRAILKGISLSAVAEVLKSALPTKKYDADSGGFDIQSTKFNKLIDAVFNSDSSKNDDYVVWKIITAAKHNSLASSLWDSTSSTQKTNIQSAIIKISYFKKYEAIGLYTKLGLIATAKLLKESTIAYEKPLSDGELQRITRIQPPNNVLPNGVQNKKPLKQ